MKPLLSPVGHKQKWEFSATCAAAVGPAIDGVSSNRSCEMLSNLAERRTAAATFPRTLCLSMLTFIESSSRRGPLSNERLKPNGSHCETR